MSALEGGALVAGAGSELGLCLCAALAAAGARPVGLAHSGAGFERLAHAGVAAFIPSSPEEAVEEAKAALGGGPAWFVDLAATRFESLVGSASPEAISVWAAEDIAMRARLLRAVARAMLARKRGRCVFVSSVAAARPGPGQAFYAAAKLAGETLFAGVGLELGRRGITACSLRLSWLEAGRGREFLKGREEAAASLMPTRRLVSLRHAVDTILFLLSPAAADINATTITLDGGFCATKPQLPALS